jgi:pimeloyl-ACP methyl ester carboxylesterase
MRRGLQAYLRWLRRDDDPARRLCEAGMPAWVVHAEQGDGGLTHERAVFEACPHVRVVTVPGQVFFLPNEVPERIADVVQARLAAFRPAPIQDPQPDPPLPREPDPARAAGTGRVAPDQP